MTAPIGRIVTPAGVVDGTLHIDGTRIAAIEPGPVPEGAPWIAPGFVDMHVHGGGGHTFTTGDADDARGAAAFHLRHGTTTLLASLVSSPPDLMLAATRAFAPLVGEGVIAGLHFEGPYLAAACRGAQNPAYLRDPSTDELLALIEVAGPGGLRMVTIAPELPGAIEVIGLLTSLGVTVAVGHTDATYAQVLAAVAAGARVGTHVFNGMRPPHHRTPGPVYALLGAPEVTCEFVADGVHLADGTLAFATGAVGARRTALVTDAIAATGMADGAYELGGQAVVVAGGVARLATGDKATRDKATRETATGDKATGETAIAGSTLTMDAAFRRLVSVGRSIVDASLAASTNPARVLGLTDRGALTPGRRADTVTLDADLRIVAVTVGGAAVTAVTVGGLAHET